MRCCDPLGDLGSQMREDYSVRGCIFLKDKSFLMFLEPSLEIQKTLVNWRVLTSESGSRILGNEIGLDFKDA